MRIIRIACLHCGKSGTTLDTYREFRSWLRLTRAWVTQCCNGAAASNFLLLFVCKISSSENNWSDSSSTLGALQSLEKMNTNCCERIRATNHKPDWLNMKNEHRRARLFESVSVCIFQLTDISTFFPKLDNNHVPDKHCTSAKVKDTRALSTEGHRWLLTMICSFSLSCLASV